MGSSKYFAPFASAQKLQGTKLSQFLPAGCVRLLKLKYEILVFDFSLSPIFLDFRNVPFLILLTPMQCNAKTKTDFFMYCIVYPRWRENYLLAKSVSKIALFILPDREDDIGMLCNTSISTKTPPNFLIWEKRRHLSTVNLDNMKICYLEVNTESLDILLSKTLLDLNNSSFWDVLNIFQCATASFLSKPGQLDVDII